MKTIPDDRTWLTPSLWGAATLALTVIVFTLDPLWAYFGAWATGFMTALSAIKTWMSKYERARLEVEEEELLLEVREANDDGPKEGTAASEAERGPSDRAVPPPESPS